MIKSSLFTANLDVVEINAFTGLDPKCIAASLGVYVKVRLCHSISSNGGLLTTAMSLALVELLMAASLAPQPSEYERLLDRSSPPPDLTLER